MGWKDHVKDKSNYYKKQKENKEASSSDLSKGIIYQNPRAGEIFKFFLVPHPKREVLSLTRGLHWMGKGKRNVRCPIFCREEQDYLPDPFENENTFDASRRAFDNPDGPRCAWCELNLAAYQLDNEKIQDNTFDGGPGNDRSISLRVDFFVLPYEKMFEDPPECFSEQPDWNNDDCKACSWNGECFLQGMAINILEKTPGVEQKLIRAIEAVEDELGDPDDDILDLENAVMFKFETIKTKGKGGGEFTEYDISTSMKRYNVAESYEKIYGEDIFDMLEKSWPSDENLFSASHTYTEMMADMRGHERNCLLAFLSEENTEAPGFEGDMKSKDDDDEPKSRKGKRSKRVADDDDDDSRSRKRRTKRKVVEEEPEEEEVENETEEEEEEESPKGKKFGTRRRRPPIEEEENEESETEEEEENTTSRRIKNRKRRRG